MSDYESPEQQDQRINEVIAKLEVGKWAQCIKTLSYYKVIKLQKQFTHNRNRLFILKNDISGDIIYLFSHELRYIGDDNDVIIHSLNHK